MTAVKPRTYQRLRQPAPKNGRGICVQLHLTGATNAEYATDHAPLTTTGGIQ